MTTSDQIPYQHGEWDSASTSHANGLLDEVEHLVSNVTDADIQQRLRALLAKNGYVHPHDVSPLTHPSAADELTLGSTTFQTTADELIWPELDRTSSQQPEPEPDNDQLRCKVAQGAINRVASADERADAIRNGVDAYVDQALDRLQDRLTEAQAEAEAIIAAAHCEAEKITTRAGALSAAAHTLAGATPQLSSESPNVRIAFGRWAESHAVQAGSLVRVTSLRVQVEDVDVHSVLISAGPETRNGDRDATDRTPQQRAGRTGASDLQTQTSPTTSAQTPESTNAARTAPLAVMTASIDNARRVSYGDSLLRELAASGRLADYYETAAPAARQQLHR
ncbi:hypothetical protein, partial [Dactylosporangium matsuzakiense]|uniref:hypothetical protein n=1 Tax=Dactylosporangium matsuzakiense TaxID=53360 RepID=UPI0022F2F561